MQNKKTFVAGHRGMVGSAVLRELERQGYTNIITKTRQELDLLNQGNVFKFFQNERPEIVIIAAAKVGGVYANNTYRGDFIYDNIQISSNIIKASQVYDVEKLINLGSSCIYPVDAPKPIKEESLLTGTLEPTNEPYAIAKIAALKMCESFFRQYGSNFYSLMPCNMYGINDNFNLETSHVLPALIAKTFSAKNNNDKSITLWGSGDPLREFLFCDDLAEAIIFCINNIDAKNVYDLGISHLNIGSDDEVSILELAHLVKKVVGFEGEIVFDLSKPDGMYRKKMNWSRMQRLGFNPSHNLRQGLEKTCDWYKSVEI
jgi:GDP-L-fucose synthase